MSTTLCWTASSVQDSNKNCDNIPLQHCERQSVASQPPNCGCDTCAPFVASYKTVRTEHESLSVRPDYGNMSLDDAAPQAATALLTAALPSITNCELTNVNFNCVIARMHIDHTCQSTSSRLTTSEIRVVVISPCRSELDTLLDTTPDTLPVGSASVVAPCHAFSRGLVNLWRKCSACRY